MIINPVSLTVSYARHTTTNLRNAARFMSAYNVSTATIVTSIPQSFYLSYPGKCHTLHFHEATVGSLLFLVIIITVVDRFSIWSTMQT
jgi:hypothetical protein